MIMDCGSPNDSSGSSRVSGSSATAHSILTIFFIGAMLAECVFAIAESNQRPSEPIVSIDGQHVFLGELNLILGDRFGADLVQGAAMEMKQAAAAILVRRHLAMRSLLQQGGDTLKELIRRDYRTFEEDLKHSGSSVQAYAQSRAADEHSVAADLAWRTAWRTYLRSRMTDDNLRKYFQREHQRYDGGRWDVSHLFLPVDRQDQTAVASTVVRMKSLAEKLRAADSVEDAFAASARQYSEAGSAQQGGRVGWVRYSGDLPKQLMRAARQLKAGQMSEPIRSPLGVHLLLVHRYEPGTLTFDELEDQSRLRRDAADMLFDDLVDRHKDAEVIWHLDQYRPSSSQTPARRP